MIAMDWNTVANIASPLLLAAIGLAIRDQARKAAKSAMDEFEPRFSDQARKAAERVMNDFEPRFKLMLSEALTNQLVLINGTYTRTKVQEVNNTNFRDRIQSHDERLNSHSERIRDLERSPQFRPIQGT